MVENQKTIKNYNEEKNCILQFITEEEFLLFKDIIDNIFELEEKKNQKEEFLLIAGIIDEILSTRHKLEEICANNFFPCERFKVMLTKTTYIEDNFGVKIKETVKEKISKNGRERLNGPRDMILVQDKEFVLIAKSDKVYLNRVDYKNLEYVCTYLCNDSNLDLVAKKYETNVDAVLLVLSNPQIEEIIKPEHYKNLQRYIEIERFLLNSTLEQKRMYLQEFINVLNEYKFDKEMVLKHYKITETLMNKILLEIIEKPIFNEEIKSEINQFLGLSDEKKVK